MWHEIKVPGSFRSLLAFAGGTIFGLVLYLLHDIMRVGLSVMDQDPLPSRGPWLMKVLLWIPRLFIQIESWPWIVLLFLALAGLAFVLRAQERGWAFAFTAGVALIETVHQVILRM